MSKNIESKNKQEYIPTTLYPKDIMQSGFDTRKFSPRLQKILTGIPEEVTEELIEMSDQDKLDYLSDFPMNIQIGGQQQKVISTNFSNEEVAYCNLPIASTAKNGVAMSVIALKNISSQKNEKGCLEGEIDVEKIEILNIKGQEILISSQFKNSSLFVSYYDIEKNELVFSSENSDEIFTGIYKITHVFFDKDSNNLKYEICKDFTGRDLYTAVGGQPSEDDPIVEKYTNVSQEAGIVTGENREGEMSSFPFIKVSEENLPENKTEYLKYLQIKPKTILKVKTGEHGAIEDGFIESIDPKNLILALKIEDTRNKEKEYTLEYIGYNGVLTLKEVLKEEVGRKEAVLNYIFSFFK